MQLLIILISVIIAVGSIYALADKDGRALRPSPLGYATALAVVVGGFILATSVVFVPFGTNEIVTLNGALTDRILYPGMNFKIPVVNGTWKMNVGMRALHVDQSEVFTKDQQNANNDYVINFQLQDSHLKDVASQFRGDGSDTSISDTLIRPRADYWLKQIEPQYNAADLLTHRSDVANALQRALAKDVAPYGVTIPFVSITNITFGPKYQEASEARAAAEQEYQRELTVLKTKAVLANQISTLASGQAKANETIRRSLGDNAAIADAIVRMRALEIISEGWHDGVLPKAMGAGSVLSFGDGSTQK